MRWIVTVKEPYNLIVSRRAKTQIENHINFLARVNVKSAKLLKENLIKDVKSLTNMPQRNGFLTSDFIAPNKYHKMLSQKRYLLIYQIKDNTVYLDFVVDCRQDYDWLIK